MVASARSTARSTASIQKREKALRKEEERERLEKAIAKKQAAKQAAKVPKTPKIVKIKATHNALDEYHADDEGPEGPFVVRMAEGFAASITGFMNLNKKDDVATHQSCTIRPVKKQATKKRARSESESEDTTDAPTAKLVVRRTAKSIAKSTAKSIAKSTVKKARVQTQSASSSFFKSLWHHMLHPTPTTKEPVKRPVQLGTFPMRRRLILASSDSESPTGSKTSSDTEEKKISEVETSEEEISEADTGKAETSEADTGKAETSETETSETETSETETSKVYSDEQRTYANKLVEVIKNAEPVLFRSVNLQGAFEPSPENHVLLKNGSLNPKFLCVVELAQTYKLHILFFDGAKRRQAVKCSGRHEVEVEISWLPIVQMFQVGNYTKM